MQVRYFHSRIAQEEYEDLDNHKGRPSEDCLNPYCRKESKFEYVKNRKVFPFSQPSPKGGMTECIIYDDVGNQFSGRSYCSLADNFCYRIGREIAYGRAYKNYLANLITFLPN